MYKFYNIWLYSLYSIFTRAANLNVCIEHICYRVLPLEFELVNSQRLGVLQLLDLLHPLVVASGLLNDEHLYTPAGKERQYLCLTWLKGNKFIRWSEQESFSLYFLSWQPYVVVLATSFMLSSGSAESGQRRIHGANTMANELGDMRLWATSLETLQERCQTEECHLIACTVSFVLTIQGLSELITLKRNVLWFR